MICFSRFRLAFHCMNIFAGCKSGKFIIHHNHALLLGDSIYFFLYYSFQFTMECPLRPSHTQLISIKCDYRPKYSWFRMEYLGFFKQSTNFHLVWQSSILHSRDNYHKMQINSWRPWQYRASPINCCENDQALRNYIFLCNMYIAKASYILHDEEYNNYLSFNTRHKCVIRLHHLLFNCVTRL